MSLLTKKVKKSSKEFIKDGIYKGDWSTHKKKIDIKKIGIYAGGGLIISTELGEKVTQAQVDKQLEYGDEKLSGK